MAKQDTEMVTKDLDGSLDNLDAEEKADLDFYLSKCGAREMLQYYKLGAHGDGLLTMFKDYWTSIGVVSALMAGMTLGLGFTALETSGTPSEDAGWLDEGTRETMQHLFGTCMNLSSLSSLGSVVMCAILYNNFISMTDDDDVLFFVSSFPTGLPDILQTVGILLVLPGLVCGSFAMYPIVYATIISVACGLLLILVLCVWLPLLSKVNNHVTKNLKREEKRQLLKAA